MNIRVYLSESVRKESRFTQKPADSRNGIRCLLGDIPLSFDNGRLYLEFSQPMDRVSPVLQSFIEQVTLVACSTTTVREAGIYGDDSTWAKAWVTRITCPDMLEIKLTGASIKDVVQLYGEILAGQRRPQHSFESAQGGPSYAELQRKLTEAIVAKEVAQENTRRANEGMLHSHNRVDKLMERLQTIIARLQGGWLPWCNRRRLIKELDNLR